jgi:transposase-like protein
VSDNDDMDIYPKARTYHLDLKRCVIQSCGGELAEISYYERNNWVTVEYLCAKCGRRFTVKVEA